MFVMVWGSAAERFLVLLAPLGVWCLPQKVGTGLLNPQQDEGPVLPTSEIRVLLGTGASPRAQGYVQVQGEDPSPSLSVQGKLSAPNFSAKNIVFSMQIMP